MLTAAIVPVGVTMYPGGQAEAPGALRHRSLMAFAGLARPEVFAATLQELGVEVKGFQAFPDHHAYSPGELDRLLAVARALGAAALVTTGKDWARLGERWDGELPLWVLEVEARLEDDGFLELRDGAGGVEAAPGPTAPLPTPYRSRRKYFTILQRV